MELFLKSNRIEFNIKMEELKMTISIFRNGERIELTNKEIANIASYYHDEDVYEAIKEELIEKLSSFLEEYYNKETSTEHVNLKDLSDVIYDVVADRVNNNDAIVDNYIKQSDNEEEKYFSDICEDDDYSICEEIEHTMMISF